MLYINSPPVAFFGYSCTRTARTLRYEVWGMTVSDGKGAA